MKVGSLLTSGLLHNFTHVKLKEVCLTGWTFLYLFRGGSRTAATAKMELLVIIVNGFQPLTIILKSSILAVTAVLDPPLQKM